MCSRVTFLTLLAFLKFSMIYGQHGVDSSEFTIYRIIEEAEGKKEYVSKETESYSKFLINTKDSTFEFFYANTEMVLKYSFGTFRATPAHVLLFNSDTSRLKKYKGLTIFEREHWKDYGFLLFINAKFQISPNSLIELPPNLVKKSREKRLLLGKIFEKH